MEDKVKTPDRKPHLIKIRAGDYMVVQGTVWWVRTSYGKVPSLVAASLKIDGTRTEEELRECRLTSRPYTSTV